MKRSDKRTAYIMLKAATTSEYNECDFAIVHITQEWNMRMAERLQLLKLFQKDDSFISLALREAVEGFYTFPEDINSPFTGREAWCFIEITPEELRDLPEINEEITGCNILFYGGSLACFYASTPEDGVELSTVLFNIKALLEMIAA